MSGAGAGTPLERSFTRRHNGDQPVNRDKVLQRLARAWEDLRDAYAGLSETELLEPGVTGAWSVGTSSRM